jgi:hypothetical protein
MAESAGPAEGKEDKESQNDPAKQKGSRERRFDRS